MALLENVFRSNREGMGVIGPILDLFRDRFGNANDAADQVRNAGYGDAADSWISTGPNQPVPPEHMNSIFGEDIERLAAQYGVSPQMVSQIMAELLPQALDHATPQGQVTQDSSIWSTGLNAIRNRFGL